MYYLADLVIICLLVADITVAIVFSRPCSYKLWNGIYVMYCAICKVWTCNGNKYEYEYEYEYEHEASVSDVQNIIG